MGLFCLFLLVLVTAAFADPVTTLYYQKTLTSALTSSKTVVPINVTFSLYDSAIGGELLWSETKPIEANSATRLIETDLGDINPLSVSDFKPQMWVQVSTTNSENIVKVYGARDALAGAPYALWSASGIAGPQGPRGPQGIQGPTGPQGPPGNTPDQVAALENQVATLTSNANTLQNQVAALQSQVAVPQQQFGVGDPTSSVSSQFYLDYASGYLWANVGGLWQRIGNTTYDYYVDETARGCAGSGCSDSNNGRTPATAFASLHKLDQLSVAFTAQVAWKAADGTWIPAPPWAGILAEYDFIKGTVSKTLYDKSGNGNNGTLGTSTAAPSWTTEGMTFSGKQYVRVSINGLTNRSIAHLASLNSAYIPNLQILTWLNCASWPYVYDAWMDRGMLYTQASYSGGSGSSTADLANGTYNDVEFNNPFLFISSWGTGAGSCWFNGLKIPASSTPTGNAPDSANIVSIGANADNSAFQLHGTYSRLLIYNRALTDADALAIQRWMYLAELKQNRGITVPAFLMHPGHSRILCSGDSLTGGCYASSPEGSYPSQLRAMIGNVDVITGPVGVNSSTLVAGETYTVSVDSRYPNEILVVWIGHNDLYIGTSPATVLSNITNYCQTAKAMGFKVIVLPVIPSTYITGTNEANRQTLNGLMASGYSSFADVFVDLNTDSRLETPTDKTYFHDGTHLTNAGYGIVASIVYSAIKPFLQ